MDTTLFARGLVAAFNRLQTVTRPIDRKVAAAEFHGMCKAADRLGLVTTETALDLDVRDAFRETMSSRGPRPGYRAMSNAAQQDWDEAVAQAIVAKINA